MACRKWNIGAYACLYIMRYPATPVDTYLKSTQQAAAPEPTLGTSSNIYIYACSNGESSCQLRFQRAIWIFRPRKADTLFLVDLREMNFMIILTWNKVNVKQPRLHLFFPSQLRHLISPLLPHWGHIHLTIQPHTCMMRRVATMHAT